MLRWAALTFYWLSFFGCVGKDLGDCRCCLLSRQQWEGIVLLGGLR
jgi:hypothetical protein